ncbi:HTH_Tnp_Tc3_2 domain-containing protein [Trichonephila clavipes]|nr:HTH_Tnp_Tc3_2 domain-containing protein [Trichonephila clavipes]
MHNKNAAASSTSTGTRVSKVTVSRRLHERGLLVTKLAGCISLSCAKRRINLKFCRDHGYWSIDEWESIRFTDKSRFSLTSDSLLTSICNHYQGPATYPPITEKSILTAGEAG